MLLRRCYLRRCSPSTIIIMLVACLALTYYMYYQHSLIAAAGWKLPKWNESRTPNPDFLWQARVKECCKGEVKNGDSPEDIEPLKMLGVLRDKKDKYIRDIGFKNHAFNALISNNIGPYREVPDTRHKVCPREPTDPNEDLPTISVVMCFYNEHKMTLIRSINSVIKRTPAHILKEIILVDDFSDLPELEFHLLSDLHAQLHYDRLHYIRNDKREGLIRSRIVGADAAEGDVLVFLDSHIEVNQQWAEPLVRAVKQENSTIAVPVMDLISPDTFDYSASPLVRGGFNWGLHYKWITLPKGSLKKDEDFKGPFKTPTMAGGLFAVNRQYFKHIGAYDDGMDIWGGENIEISFRVWQCHGAIKIYPCSRVGHIFRKRRPYSAPDGKDTMKRNSLRAAHVWMDEYKEYFLKETKSARDMDYGDISARLEIRKRLKCHDFSWYMKNIYPEMLLPGQETKKNAAAAGVYQPWHSRKRNYVATYMIRLTGTNLCASVVAPKVKGFLKKGSPLILQACMHTRNQIWYETDKAEIVLDKLLCLESYGDAQVHINKCHEMLGDQQWRHTRTEHSPIYNMAAGTCMRAKAAQVGAGIILDLCSKDDASAWDIVKVEETS
ncbi:LOW QUALITY PROTEIN: polypeptide N-acetylgalactosaminyltransferase 35A [Anastrepha obliqua]|uniref:LOW QUALITY PROTEIN: polypeptide N-acetylgalactosaminyltransferase 35A n=1 Tax=Anastrepha obliqua TaxID=95512 RepID=UPI002409F7ED|nr:LOW QUALITY PROTEIN: polypeptide N-acetylgalactosaminyltransferase 35A [Anastrepha obliqua]